MAKGEILLKDGGSRAAALVAESIASDAWEDAVASLMSPIIQSAGDADFAATDTTLGDSVEESPTYANIPAERWLHRETVGELRQRRARKGLPVSQSPKSVPRPPFTAPSEPFIAATVPTRTLAARAESRIAQLARQFGSIVETANRLAARISATIVVFVASYLSALTDCLRDE